MKIGFISEHYPPTDGGVATSTQRVARHLHRLGAEVQVFCFDHSLPLSSADYVRREVDEGVHVARVGPFFLKQKDKPVDSVPEKLKATFRRRATNQIIHMLRQDSDVDILLSFYLLNAGFLATYVARELGIPVVAGVRGNDIGRNIFHTERFAVTQWVIGGADRVVCVNNFLRRRLLLAFPEAAAKSLVIANTVLPTSQEPPERHAARRSILDTAGWDAAAVVVTFIGTLREKKGVAVLVEALDRLGPDSPVRLLVIGPSIGNLERQICGDVWDRLAENGRIWWTGRVPLEAVSGWAAGADVVVMPSLDDGMANGLLEGMAQGLCPIATDIFSDVVSDSESGIIVQAGDSASLARGLAQVATDAILRQRLGAAAKAVILRRSPTQEAREYLDVFEEVLVKRDATRRIQDI